MLRSVTDVFQLNIHVAEVQPISCEGELMPLCETLSCLIVDYSLVYLQLSSYAHAPNRVTT